MAEHVSFGELKGGGRVSIRKLNTKTKLPATYYKSPETEIRSFPSLNEKLRHKWEGKERTAEGKAMGNVFVVSRFESALLAQLTIKINWYLLSLSSVIISRRWWDKYLWRLKVPCLCSMCQILGTIKGSAPKTHDTLKAWRLCWHCFPAVPQLKQQTEHHTLHNCVKQPLPVPSPPLSFYEKKKNHR